MNNLLYLFRLLAKIPYYKLGSYAFLITLLFYAVSVFVNYMYWALEIAFSFNMLQPEIWIKMYIIQPIFSGHFSVILNPVDGNILTIPLLWIAFNVLFFHGSWWFSSIVDIFLMLSVLYMFYRVLCTMNIPRYTFWVLFSWIVIMLFIPINLKWLGSEESMPLYAYFMGILDFILLLKLLKFQKSHLLKKILFHGLLVVLLILTSFTWSIGIIVWPIIIFLLLLKQEYKLFLIYILCLCLFLIGIYFISYVYNAQTIGSSTSSISHFTFVKPLNLLKYMFTLFSSPASNSAEQQLTTLAMILAYIRGSIVIGLTIWVLYISRIFKIFNIKKIFQNKITFSSGEIFFLGFFLWNLIILIYLVVFRYQLISDNQFFGKTSANLRYYVHFYIFAIPLFVLITIYLQRIRKKILTIIFSCMCIIYVVFILIPYNSVNVDYFVQNAGQHDVPVMMAGENPYTYTYRGGYGSPVVSKFWQLYGYNSWQHELMGININNYIAKNNLKKHIIAKNNLKNHIWDNNNTSHWLKKDTACSTCLRFFETFEYKKGKFGMPVSDVNTIRFKSITVRFPYTFSNTVFITDEKGTVVGLGNKKYHDAHFLNIITIVKYLNLKKVSYDFNGFFYNHDPKNMHTYTMWAIALDRQHISRLLTFTLKPTPNHQIHLQR